MARTALLGALVVLANALSAYVVVKTRGAKCNSVDELRSAVVAARPAPKHRRRKRLAPWSMP
jgi:hypothetical protein